MFLTKRITIRDFPAESRAILEMSQHRAETPDAPAGKDHNDDGRLKQMLMALSAPTVSSTNQGQSEPSPLEKAVTDLLSKFKEGSNLQQPRGAGISEQPDIFVVGDEPVYIVGGRLMLHDQPGSPDVTPLSFTNQDILVYESAESFSVNIRPAAPGERRTPNPFYRDDLPFTSRKSERDGVHRIVAGCIREESTQVRDYKASISFGDGRNVDPDVRCDP